MTESAIIETFRLTEQGNKIRGHQVRLYTAEQIYISNKVETVILPDAGNRYILVPISGIWGGKTFLGSMIGSSEDKVWENARHYWKLGEWPIARINNPREDQKRVLLLAIDSVPSRNGSGNTPVIVGVFELSSAHRSDDLDTQSKFEFERFVADESENAKAVRNAVLGRSPDMMEKKLQGFRYWPESGWLD